MPEDPTFTVFEPASYNLHISDDDNQWLQTRPSLRSNIEPSVNSSDAANESHDAPETPPGSQSATVPGTPEATPSTARSLTPNSLVTDTQAGENRLLTPETTPSPNVPEARSPSTESDPGAMDNSALPDTDIGPLDVV